MTPHGYVRDTRARMKVRSLLPHLGYGKSLRGPERPILVLYRNPK